MATHLCIDWGNSSVKAALFSDTDQMLETFRFSDTEALDILTSLVERHQPEAGMLCSVVHHPEQVEQMLRQQIRFFYNLDMQTRLPIMNAYHSPETLGPDRLALVAGAYAQFPDKNNLVISLGTCITYNLIQKSKAFRGGAISSGLRMRLRAMHDFTDKLPEVQPNGELLLLGYDTETSMRSGTLHGIAFEIDGMIEAFAAQYPDFNAVLTGGDMPFFEGKLKNKIFADPDLLLKGLHLILKYNVPQIR
jgi:type III pantothenate kinase